MKNLIANFKNVFTNHYIDFKGRAGREELWLFNVMLYFVFMIIYTLYYPMILISAFKTAMNGGVYSPYEDLATIYGVFLLLLIPFALPCIALGVRRLHDTGRSGLYLLLNLIPIVGTIMVTILLALDGDRGANVYGEDPKIKQYQRELG